MAASARSFARIVVGTNFTPASKRAFRKAAALAQDLGAELHLIHVACAPSARPIFFISPSPASHDALCTRLVRKAEGRLTDFLRGEELGGIRLHRAIVTGRPCAELVAYAAREEADLIVVGETPETRAQHLLQHLAFESVGERVRRTAGCPVLTVR